MESLNISKLNLCSARRQTSQHNGVKFERTEEKFEPNLLTDQDERYFCEYRDEIWNSLLEQEAEKPTFFLRSPQLEFRGTLVQQLRDVTKSMGLNIATLHTAVALLDSFMDAHRLRADRLKHIALVCFSLAAKSEEKYSRTPSLTTLAKASGIPICGKTFRQLEWMVGQHVRWRLLSPTPVTFASLLAEFVVTDEELTTRHPKFVRRFRRDGAKLLEAYLDITLSDVRLKAVENVDVGCACVACARADLGLMAWPDWLSRRAGRTYLAIAPVARLLQKMMLILKGRQSSRETDIDQGYSSAKTSPTQTPRTSPSYQASSASSTCSTMSSRSLVSVDSSYRQHPVTNPRAESECTALDHNGNHVPTTNIHEYYKLPTAVDMRVQRVSSAVDYKYCKSRRLLEASSENQPLTNMAVKRSLETNVDIDRKRYRLASHMSQVVL